MKFLFVVILAVATVAQAYVLSGNPLSAGMERNEIDGQPLVQAAMQTETLYIPMSRLTTCSNAGCIAICHALGYPHGRCVSDTTCECY